MFQEKERKCTIQLILANMYLFALRSPSPKALALAPDAVGPENDRYIQEAVTRAGKIVAAWGNEGARDGRERAVLSRISRPVFCLGTTGLGHPRHPLYVKAQTELCPLERIQHWSGEDRLACQQQKADCKSI